MFLLNMAPQDALEPLCALEPDGSFDRIFAELTASENVPNPRRLWTATAAANPV